MFFLLVIIPQTCVSMRGSDIDMVENWVHTLTRVPGRGGCLRQPSRKFGTICQNLSSRLREMQNVASRRRETPHFEPDPKLPQTLRPRNMLGHLWVKIDPKSTKHAKAACHFFQDTYFFRKKKLRHPRSTWVACMVGLGLRPNRTIPKTWFWS